MWKFFISFIHQTRFISVRLVYMQTLGFCSVLFIHRTRFISVKPSVHFIRSGRWLAAQGMGDASERGDQKPKKILTGARAWGIGEQVARIAHWFHFEWATRGLERAEPAAAVHEVAMVPPGQQSSI